jgi:hypothetical protein
MDTVVNGFSQAPQTTWPRYAGVSAEDIDDLDFAWEHDRKLVRAALEDGG